MATQYKGAYHQLHEFTPPMVIQPTETDGTAIAGTIQVSPEIRDIKISTGGTITETIAATGGNVGHIDITGEYVDVTLSVLPYASDTKANAALGITAMRKGTAYKVTTAGPAVQVRGHTGNLIGSTDSLFKVGNFFFLQDWNMDLSVEGKTTGSITLRYYPGIQTGTPTS